MKCQKSAEHDGEGDGVTRRKDGLETKKRILSVCVRLFIEQGYHQTTIGQILKEANVSASSFQNLFHAKDGVLNELVEFMFGSQFGAAKQGTGEKLPPVYMYALETSIQLALTELNENLRDIYVEVYSKRSIADSIHKKIAVENAQIFSSYFPEYTKEDFYYLDIGTASIMRGYMEKPCDSHFTLEKKLECFLSISLRAYRIPEKDIIQIIQFVNSFDVTQMAGAIMQKLFASLEMKFDFSLNQS